MAVAMTNEFANELTNELSTHVLLCLHHKYLLVLNYTS